MKLSNTTCTNDKVNKIILKLGQNIHFSTRSWFQSVDEDNETVE